MVQEQQETFISQLTASGIMSAAEVDAFLNGLPADKRPKDAAALARELVERDKLTRYQAAAVFQGKIRGLVFGDYVVLDRIGAGGMGQVYKARHRRMDRIVALKVLPTAAMKSPDAIARFQREVKAAARLNHSHIVTAFDAGEQEGMHYLVMEFVDGSDLSNLVKTSGPLPVKQAVDYIVQAAPGLEHAHSEGVIHRDIKPSNLLVDKKGVVKILDMGLARLDGLSAADGAGDGLTNTGNIMGTIDFMAPEQALDTKNADQRADIYSLGCTLFYLLSGKKVFEEDTIMKKLLAHREAAIPSLSALRADLPAAVNMVYQRMVAKKVADRYQTMTEARMALESAMNRPTAPLAVAPAADAPLPRGKRIEPEKPSSRPTKRGKRAAKSRTPLYAGVAAVLMVLAAGGIVLRSVLFKVETPEGTIVVEIDQPGAEVTLDEDRKLTLRTPDSRETTEVTAVPGKHILEVRKGGFKTRTQEFVLNDGQPNRIRVHLEPLAAATSSTVATPSASRPAVAPTPAVADGPSNPEVERRAAEWVLAKGGKLDLAVDGRTKSVSNANELPAGSFQVQRVLLNKAGVRNDELTNLAGLIRIEYLQLWVPDLTVAGLANLQRMSHLDYLSLHSVRVDTDGFREIVQLPALTTLVFAQSNVEDSALELLKDAKSLRALHMSGPLVTDKTLDHLPALDNLVTLHLFAAAITGSGLKNLAKLPNLEDLSLQGVPINSDGLQNLPLLPKLKTLYLAATSIDDRALAPIAALPNLANLYVDSTKVSDAGVPVIERMQKLESLRVKSTQISADGLNALKAALPNCKIDIVPGSGAPAVAASTPAIPEVPLNPALERRAAEWVLGLGGKVFVVVGNGKPTEVTGVGQLPAAGFWIDGIELNGKREVTDDSLAALDGLHHLNRLDLHNTPITNRAVDRLRRFQWLNNLNISVTAIDDAGLAPLADMPKLWLINVIGTPISDRGAETLAKSKSIHIVYAGTSQITDRGLQYLTRLPLRTLGLSSSHITDAGLKSVETCTDLQSLFIAGAEGVSDAAMASIARLENLMGLDIRSTKFTDRAVERLAGMKSLRSIQLGGSGISPAGVARLKAALPNCTIDATDRWTGVTPLLAATTAAQSPTPNGPVNPAIERRVAEWALSLGGNVWVAVGKGKMVQATRHEQLPAEAFRVRTIHLARVPLVTDSSLAILNGLSELRQLDLFEVPVTDRGLEHIRGLNSLDTILLQGNAVGDAGFAIVAKLPLVKVLKANRTQITDRSLEALAGMKGLTDLGLIDTRISQTGYEKLRAALPNCKIEWSAATGASVAAAVPADVPLAPLDTSNRLAIPAASEQQKVLETLKEVFRDEFAAAKKAEDKAALAEKLLKQAADSRDDAISAYVMLSEARNLAIDAAEPSLLARIASDIGGRFAANPLELLAESLEKSTQKPHPAASFKGLADAALDRIDEALGAEQFDAAKRLSDVALAAARKAKDSQTLKAATDRSKSLVTLKQQLTAVEAARTTLATKPDDPEANLVLGRHLCFTQGDWSVGLANLAKGSDATLKELATKSLADPQDAAAQAELGEAWAKAADAAKGKNKTELQTAARYWYNKAAPLLTGLAKAKAEQRLKQIDGDLPASRIVSRPKPGPTTSRPAARSEPADATQIARYLLELGGNISVKPEGKPEVKVTDPAALPAEKFVITVVRLSSNKRVGDTEVAPLRGLSTVRTLFLNTTNVTDAGLSNLQGFAGLQELNLSGNPQLTDQAVAHFQGLTSLKILVVNSSHISDVGLAQLNGLTNLTNLSLVGTQISGSAFAQLAGLKNLQSLMVANTPLGDAGLAELKRFSTLRVLDVSRTQITDAGLANLAGLSNLTNLTLRDTATSDAGLAPLQKLTNLRSIQVGSLVTDAGIQALQKALPAAKIER